ncbi:hypothetical protein [Guptibacillus algicola]|nr:hypothetical protein [Alkalihalobacillus algicola]
MKLNKKRFRNQPGPIKKSYTNEVDLVDTKKEQSAQQEAKKNQS